MSRIGVSGKCSLLTLLAFVLAAPLCAQTTTIYTGTIKDANGKTATSGRITWQLNPPSGDVIGGSGPSGAKIITCGINASGSPVSIADGVSPCVVTNNSSLTPTGTSYRMCVQPNFAAPGSCMVTFANGGTVDISTVVPAPEIQANSGIASLSASNKWEGMQTFAGTNNAYNAALLPGADIGDAITTKAAAMKGQGTIDIPDGTYDFSHTITITQDLQFHHLTLHCNSRNAVLNYTGDGDAIYITSNMNSASQVKIENCSVHGRTAGASANGIHLYDSQNVRLENVSVYKFKAVNLLAVGSIDGTFDGSDFSAAGQWNVKLAPDPAHRFASNANHFRGGSMQYGGSGNFWDAGDYSAYGGDTSNTLDGVTMEMSANVPQFIIEGTKNDAITNGYIEYINFSTSTGDLYAGILGNYAGSGYGCNCSHPAVAFRFTNNYMIMPKAAVGHTVAALYLINTNWLDIESLYEDGTPTYGISFYSLGTNSFDTIGPVNMGFSTALYQNAPAPHNRLWYSQDAAPGLGQYNFDSRGYAHFGGIVSSTTMKAITDIQNSHGTVIPSAVTGYHGTAGMVQGSDGTGADGNCPKFSRDGKLTDSGAPCGGRGAAPVDLGTLTYKASGTTTFAAAGAPTAGGIVTATHSTSTTFSPTGLVKWGSYTLEIKQDGTGGGTTFTLGTGGSCSAWKLGGGGAGAITLSSSANTIDVLSWTYDGTNCVANFRILFN